MVHLHLISYETSALRIATETLYCLFSYSGDILGQQKVQALGAAGFRLQKHRLLQGHAYMLRTSPAERLWMLRMCQTHTTFPCRNFPWHELCEPLQKIFFLLLGQRWLHLTERIRGDIWIQGSFLPLMIWNTWGTCLRVMRDLDLMGWKWGTSSPIGDRRAALKTALFYSLHADFRQALSRSLTLH